MKNLLFITMLLGAGYSDECEDYNAEHGTNYNCNCNEETWQEYYNSEGHNMAGCWLVGADLTGANLYMANLSYANLTDTNCWGAFFVGAELGGGIVNNGAIFDGADLQYAYFDETGYDNCNPPNGSCDGYDDFSFDAGSQTGDVNLDRELNIPDLVLSSNMIIEGE